MHDPDRHHELPPTRRDGSKRWLARALLTLGVSAAATTGFVTPALAQEEWDAPADAVAVDTTQTETAAQKARRETDDAIREAARVLLDPGCNNTISGSAPAGGESAATVLEKLSQGRVAGGDGKIYDMHTVNPTQSSTSAATRR